MKKVKKKIAVIDFETDPFVHGRIPKPFAWGFYDGARYVQHWEKDAWNNDKCAEALAHFLEDVSYDEEPMLILAHNGGKFDFLFIIKHLVGDIKIVNGRILKAKIGNHELRDSYAVLPIPLSKLGDKLEIDYMRMERDVREDHKEEICTYLKADCIELHKVVTAFYEEFGDQLTIGGTAMKALKKFHEFEPASESFDNIFRNYYFGGRCQCFEVGDIKGDFKCYDENSAYPDSMRRYKHPTSTNHTFTKTVTKNSSFVCWEGDNDNAVPVRTKTGLDFSSPSGLYWTTIHEFEAALDIGIIRPKKIIHAVEFDTTISFDDFINFYYEARLRAQGDKNLFLIIFYKLILNSAYGKFAQSPENFRDSIILPWGDVPPEPYTIEYTSGEYAIWSKPSPQKTYFNVATAASITGGARANLLRGLASAVRPLYCDTDSIICESMGGYIHQTELGAWKEEFRTDHVAIAGKKLYAAMGKKLDKKTGIEEYGCVKLASKGVRLTHEQIFAVANGATIETRNDAPTFKLDGNHVFISRSIRRTGQTKSPA